MQVTLAHTNWRPQPQRAAGSATPPKEETQEIASEHLTTDNAYGFYVNGERKMVLKGQRESVASKVIRNSRAFIGAAGSEIGALAASNPAMAFNTTMEGIKPIVMRGMPDHLAGPTDQILLPVQRAVLVLFDAYKAYDRWKQNRVLGDDAGALDQIGMAVDGAHVVTSACGLLGSVGRFVPALAGIAAIGLTIALAGDMAAYSFNMIEYINKRGKGGSPKPPQPPQPPQPPPPPPPPPPIA